MPKMGEMGCLLGVKACSWLLLLSNAETKMRGALPPAPDKISWLAASY